MILTQYLYRNLIFTKLPISDSKIKFIFGCSINIKFEEVLQISFTLSSLINKKFVLRLAKFLYISSNLYSKLFILSLNNKSETFSVKPISKSFLFNFVDRFPFFKNIGLQFLTELTYSNGE